MTDQLLLDSLRRRMRAVHSLSEDACATMGLDQVNHVIDDHGKERTPEEMVGQRIGDHDAFIEYMNVVWGRTEQFLADLDLDHAEPVR